MSFLQRVCNCLATNEIPYAIVGGYAVALHGAPRGTIDVDFIVPFDESTFVKVEEALKSIGLLPRLPVSASEVFRFRQEYIDNRNLIAWSFYNPRNPIDLVDIIITDNLDDYGVVEKKVAQANIKVISKAGLIKMKTRSGRPQDLLDIQALEKI